MEKTSTRYKLVRTQSSYADQPCLTTSIRQPQDFSLKKLATCNRQSSRFKFVSNCIRTLNTAEDVTNNFSSCSFSVHKPLTSENTYKLVRHNPSCNGLAVNPKATHTTMASPAALPGAFDVAKKSPSNAVMNADFVPLLTVENSSLGLGSVSKYKLSRTNTPLSTVGTTLPSSLTALSAVKRTKSASDKKPVAVMQPAAMSAATRFCSVSKYKLLRSGGSVSVSASDAPLSNHALKHSLLASTVNSRYKIRKHASSAKAVMSPRNSFHRRWNAGMVSHKHAKPTCMSPVSGTKHMMARNIFKWSRSDLRLKQSFHLRNGIYRLNVNRQAQNTLVLIRRSRLESSCLVKPKYKLFRSRRRVAICRRFLRGSCDVKGCSYSHNISKDKMPVCSFFLKGMCLKENCPYLHVKHSSTCPVCDDFNKGTCTKGAQCAKVHRYTFNNLKFSHRTVCHSVSDDKKQVPKLGRLIGKSSFVFPSLAKEKVDTQRKAFRSKPLPSFVSLDCPDEDI